MDKKNSGATRRQFPANPLDPFNSLLVENNRFSIGQESFAAYGKVNYELGKGMSLEAGARAELVEASLDRVKAPNPAFGIPAVVLKENRHEGYFSPTAGASVTP